MTVQSPDTVWSPVGNLKGEKGDKGDKGDPGDPGTGGSGGGAVASVNGRTGAVVLAAADVGADPAGAATAESNARAAAIQAESNARAAAIQAESNARAAADQTNANLAAQAQATANAALPRSGGTLTGDLILAADPTNAFHPATRQWTLARIADLVGGLAPADLDTFVEVAARIQSGDSAVTTLTNVVAGKQPLDDDLTAIAGLATTPVGRALLTIADAAAGRTALGLGSAATHAHTDYETAGAASAAATASQPRDADLTAIAALATTTFGRSLLEQPDAAATRATIGAAPAAKRVLSVASTATLTVDSDAYDMATVTAQAAGLTVANPTGAPVVGRTLVVRIKDDGTSRALAWGTQWRGIGLTLPTSTVAGKLTYVGAFYNAVSTAWDVTALAREA